MGPKSDSTVPFDTREVRSSWQCNACEAYNRTHRKMCSLCEHPKKTNGPQFCFKGKLISSPIVAATTIPNPVSAAGYAESMQPLWQWQNSSQVKFKGPSPALTLSEMSITDESVQDVEIEALTKLFSRLSISQPFMIKGSMRKSPSRQVISPLQQYWLMHQKPVRTKEPAFAPEPMEIDTFDPEPMEIDKTIPVWSHPFFTNSCCTTESQRYFTRMSNSSMQVKRKQLVTDFDESTAAKPRKLFRASRQLPLYFSGINDHHQRLECIKNNFKPYFVAKQISNSMHYGLSFILHTVQFSL